MIDCFIKRMTVLGRGLVFQPVLVTQTCTYSSNDIAYRDMLRRGLATVWMSCSMRLNSVGAMTLP